MSIKRLHCAVCGKVELSKAEYDQQMIRDNARWVCPRSGRIAEWVGEFSPCPVCDNSTSHDEEDCQHCGINQQAIYYAMRGEANAQAWVRKQCDDMSEDGGA